MKTDRRKQDLSEMSQLFILLDFYEYIKFRQYFFATEKKYKKKEKEKSTFPLLEYLCDVLKKNNKPYQSEGHKDKDIHG